MWVLVFSIQVCILSTDGYSFSIYIFRSTVFSVSSFSSSGFYFLLYSLFSCLQYSQQYIMIYIIIPSTLVTSPPRKFLTFRLGQPRISNSVSAALVSIAISQVLDISSFNSIMLNISGSLRFVYYITFCQIYSGTLSIRVLRSSLQQVQSCSFISQSLRRYRYISTLNAVSCRFPQGYYSLTQSLPSLQQQVLISIVSQLPFYTTSP